jgi:hypothetical protein
MHKVVQNDKWVQFFIFLKESINFKLIILWFNMLFEIVRRVSSFVL